jgi:hypothetical protein
MFECSDQLRTLGKEYHPRSNISIGTAVSSRPNGLAFRCRERSAHDTFKKPPISREAVNFNTVFAACQLSQIVSHSWARR